MCLTAQHPALIQGSIEDGSVSKGAGFNQAETIMTLQVVAQKRKIQTIKEA
jgi:hypothetical protein